MDTKRRRVGRMAALAIAVATVALPVAHTDPAEALCLETDGQWGCTVGGWQFASAVYEDYPGGFFNVYVEPLGSGEDSTPNAWRAAGVVSKPWPCDDEFVWLWLNSRDAGATGAFVVDPSLSAAQGEVSGVEAVSCNGGADTYEYEVSFTMLATGAPEHGETINPDAPSASGYVERDGIASARFCWFDPFTDCQTLGTLFGSPGDSTIGYRYQSYP